MANIKVSPEVLEILQNSTITGNLLVLPPGQLERSLYEAVNKVIVNAGGKWKKGKGHVFTDDPRVKLGLAMETGVSVDEKKLFQAFYTPSALAAQLVELANVNGMSVLEPSMGEGAIISECLVQGATKVTGIEINPEAFKIACKKSLSASLLSDFLKVIPAGEMADFDRVVMNPPFTKNQDITHVTHALKFLKKGGRLAAIMSPNIGRAKFQSIVSGLNYTIHEIEAGAFKESGTTIKTIILVINT